MTQRVATARQVITNGADEDGRANVGGRRLFLLSALIDKRAQRGV